MSSERGKDILYHVASREAIKERANKEAAVYGIQLIDLLKKDEGNTRRMLQMSSEQLALLSLLSSREFLDAQVSIETSNRYLRDGRTFSGCYTAAGRIISMGTVLAYDASHEFGEQTGPHEVVGQLLVDYPLALRHPETIIMTGTRGDQPIDTMLFHLIPKDVEPESYIASHLEPLTLARDGGLHVRMRSGKKNTPVTMHATIPDTHGFMEIDYHHLGTIGKGLQVYGHNGRSGTNYRLHERL